MSAAPILTIAIPTHDRNELLAKNVPRLFEQLTPHVRVLIIDNASPTPVSVTLGTLPDGVRLIRNLVNIGGNGNILRCLELCETPWVMVMGDDDCPLPDMVSRILDDIAANRDAMILHYATVNMLVRDQEWLTRGRREFLSRVDSFGNLLFISSSVFQIAQLREVFDRAQHFAYSCAPHLALLLTGMGSQSIAVFRSSSLVDWKLPEIENRGSKFPIALGLPTLLELPLAAAERRLLGKILARFITPGELLHEALVSALFGGRTRIEALRQYLHALHRLPMHYSLFRRLWGWYLAPMILTPSSSYSIVGRVARAKIGRPMGRNNLREERL